MLTRMCRSSTMTWMVAFLSLFVLAALPVLAQTPVENKTVVFLGGAYESPDKGFIGSVGGGAKLTGGLWTLGHGKFGDNAALEGEIAYLIPLTAGFVIGTIAGAGNDWISANSEATPISYLTGAAGALLGFHPKKIGVYAGGKYKVTYKENTAYPAGWRVGLWLVYNP